MKIQGFSSYEIYPNEGKIWSYKSNKFIGVKNIQGYWKCTLYADNGTIWRTNLHRVIWTAVNGEIPKGMQVNHIDENKDNNSISNLELLTPKENTNFGTRNERASNVLKGRNINNPNFSKCVGAFKDGVLQMVFPSIREAQRQGYDRSNVISCCKGKYWNNNTYKGFQWQYIN